MNSTDSEDINYDLFILNEKNKYLTKKYVETTLAKYGVKHKVKSLETFQKAMIHKSYMLREPEYWRSQRSKKTNKDLDPIDDPSNAIPLMDKSYERLEFLGDAVIHLILAEYFFTRYENEDEGFMTRLRTKIENGNTLAQLSRAVGIDEYVLVSRFIEKNGGRTNNLDLLEDTFEAFMGALFLDGGFPPCQRFFITLIEDKIDLAKLLHTETNYKDVLLQYFHRMRWADPKYGVMDITGPENNKLFTVYVMKRENKTDDGDIVGIGIGSSKKKGEQEAAKKALIKFGEVKEDEGYGSDSVEEMTDDEFDDSVEEFEEEDEKDELKCKKCKKEFRKPFTLKRHVERYCKG